MAQLLKLLFIEDNMFDQLAFKRFVSITPEFNFDYIVCNSVREAKDALESNKFDIIISDFELGDGDAFDILQSDLNIPFIITTGSGNEEIAVKAMKLGAFDYIIKDIDGHYFTILPQTIKNAIKRYKTEQQLKEYQENLEVLVKERTSELEKEIAVRKEIEITLKQKNLEAEKNLQQSIILNHELEKSKLHAEESDRLKTAFLHNISHEIRTPMNAIVGFSGFLLDDDLDSDKRKSFIEIIVKSSNQLLHIITDIIRISSIQTGQEKVNESEIKLNETLHKIYDQFKPEASDKEIALTLNTTLPDDSVNILTDEKKFVQILTNLIHNAIKFTEEGEISFGYTIEEKNLICYIKDTGIGIPEDMHKLIFDRFCQVEDANSCKYGGSGLGLSIAEAFVQLLGGEIWLTSELGKGSVFYFSIPFKQRNENHENTPTISDSILLSKELTLLVAEDEESNFMLIEEMLSPLNINLLRARNGLQAVEICNNQHIDLVLMDIKMPILNGYDATIQIKEMHKDLPIIAQTAYITNSERERALESGCSDYISKPIKKELLLEKIKKQLNRNI